jgi:hypothetical protein
MGCPLEFLTISRAMNVNKNNLKRAAEELRVQQRQKATVKVTSSNSQGHQQQHVAPQFGHPKGTTESNSREAHERIRLATVASAKEYKAAMIEKRKNGKHYQRLQRGTIKSIIARAKQMYNVEDHIRVSKSTIRSKCMRNCVQPPVQQGTPSPMLAIEPHLVELIIQLARMQCPINVTSGLQLANSRIAGTPIAKQLVKWKIKHKCSNAT